MLFPATPDNESIRLQALQELCILDTPSEESLEEPQVQIEVTPVEQSPSDQSEAPNSREIQFPAFTYLIS